MNIYWKDQDQAIAVIEFDKPWEWDEFHTAVYQVHRTATKKERPVTLLLWHRVSLPEGNINVHYRRAAERQPANIAAVVNIAENDETAQRLDTLPNQLTDIPADKLPALVRSEQEAEVYLNTRRRTA